MITKFIQLKEVRLIKIVFLLITSLTLFQCSKDDPAPSTGKIAGKITDVNTGSSLEGVIVIAFDASSNSPYLTATSNASGDYSMNVAPGVYFLNFYKQGYYSLPPSGIDAIPFEVLKGATINQPVEMTANEITNAGYIQGKVTGNSTSNGGILVVAEGTGTAYSGVTDKDGNYTIFNVPAGSYDVKAFVAEYSSTAANASVTANTATSNVNITVSKNATGVVSGTFKVISQTTIATPPTEMKISLVHKLTGETIPGLSLSLPYSSSISFTFNNVPDGNYIIRATYENDYIVIDPDYITKFGDYQVTLSNGVVDPVTVDIVATSAVILNTPTNEMASTVPVSVSTTPTFSWSAYPSTSDYIIEVTDATTGQVIWGGFTNNNGTVTKNIVIPSNTTSVQFNFDGSASITSLTPGNIYRWRVYASKNNVQTGWNLIAASENQMGLIKIE